MIIYDVCNPRPRHIEIPHPAIYSNHGTHSLLTREYSKANQEQRVDRFGTHALHIFEAIEDVREKMGTDIYKDIESRRLQLFS